MISARFVTGDEWLSAGRRAVLTTAHEGCADPGPPVPIAEGAVAAAQRVAGRLVRDKRGVFDRSLVFPARMNEVKAHFMRGFGSGRCGSSRHQRDDQ